MRRRPDGIYVRTDLDNERAEDRRMTRARSACPHIPTKARTHPANHGRTIRCCDCFLKAHPEYRPILGKK